MPSRKKQKGKERKASKASTAPSDDPGNSMVANMMRDAFKPTPDNPCPGVPEATAFLEEMGAKMAREHAESSKKTRAAADQREKVRRAFERRVVKLEFGDVTPVEVADRDCVICSARLPRKISASVYMPCCGAEICQACMTRGNNVDAKNFSCFDFAPGRYEELKIGRSKCMFCRSEVFMIPDTREEQDYINKLLCEKAQEGQLRAMYELGNIFERGRTLSRLEIQKKMHEGNCNIFDFRYNIDKERADELFRQAADNGFGEAYMKFAKKAEGADDPEAYLLNLQKAAECGCPDAVEKLANLSMRKGMVSQAARLYGYVANIGHGVECMEQLETLFDEGFLTKAALDECKEAYSLAKKEMFSEDRDALARMLAHESRDGSLVKSDLFM